MFRYQKVLVGINEMTRMRRRSLLAGIGLTTAALAGCMGSDEAEPESGDNDEERKNENGDNDGGRNGENKDIEYEKCDNTTVGIQNLPEPAKDEVLTALWNREYETSDDLTLQQVIDVDKTYLAMPDVTFKAEIEKVGVRTFLRLEPKRPLATPPDLNLYAPETEEDDVTVNLSVLIVNDSGLLINETFEETVSPDPIRSTIELRKLIDQNSDLEYRWGRYRGKFTVENGGDEWTEEVEWIEAALTSVFDIPINVKTGRIRPKTVEMGAIPPCKWNDDGELKNEHPF